jgi:serine phosphatase RsbU (regulator of sigma subunit)
VTDTAAHPTIDPEALDAILRPFSDVTDELTVHIEHPGDSVGSADTNTPRVARDLEVEGRFIGRLVAEGPGVLEPAVAAALEAVAVAIERLGSVAPLVPRASIDASVDQRGGLAAELALSRLQQRSLVSLEPPEVPGYDLASYYEPAREIGGDFFELFRLRRRGQPLGIVIADVTGKGIAAALLMAFARPVVHAALQAASGPADALRRTNRILVEELHTPLFITAVAGRLDIRTGRLRLAIAGHEPPLLVPAGGGPIVPVGDGGPMLGMSSPLALVETEVELGPGDRLLLYTDGLTDAITPDGERFGKARVTATIEGARGGSTADLVAALSSAVDGFCRGAQQVDDVTLVAVGRHPLSA